jgi:hypothetical protein
MELDVTSCSFSKFILNERTMAKHPQHALQNAALQQLFIAIVCLPVAFAGASISRGAFTCPNLSNLEGNWKVVATLLYIRILTTGAAVWFQMVALARISAGEVTVRVNTTSNSRYQFLQVALCSGENHARTYSAKQTDSYFMYFLLLPHS